MIRNATPTDIERIANDLWSVRQHLKALQIATPLSGSTREALAREISLEMDQWLVCESSKLEEMGYFKVGPLGHLKNFKRFRFPEHSIQIGPFACLLKGEVLLPQFEQLVAHLPEKSILVCISSPLRDAYWAALKAGFKLLGESSMIVGTYAWLYFDREQRHEEIQNKLRRSRIISR